MTSDADMWALNKEFYDSHTDVPGKDVALLFANKDMKTFAACYIAMKIRFWREIMNVSFEGDFAKSVREYLETNLFVHKPNRFQQFDFDQDEFAKRLKTWKHFPSRVHFVQRNITHDRIDRYSWREYNGVGDPAVESHVLTPAFHIANWSRLRRMLHYLLTAEEMIWVDAYASGFCHTAGCAEEKLRTQHPLFSDGFV